MVKETRCIVKIKGEIQPAFLLVKREVGIVFENQESSMRNAMCNKGYGMEDN